MNRILIKSDREYLREVFSRIEKGKYAVPSFQRDFIWRENQVLELFDSIIKGYPIGAITLWHSEDLYKRKDILTDHESEDKQFDYYILDGRQRLTALYGCCSGANDSCDKRFSLSYDLLKNKLVYTGTATSYSWIVPISEVYDTFKMLGRLRQVQDSLLSEADVARCNERLMQINTILQEYVISEILIEKCTLQEAGEVFARINSKGTDINQREMLQAVAFGKSSGGILINREINYIQQKLAPYGFGELDNGTIMNCFYKFAGLNFYENNALELARYDFENHMEEITTCLCATASFLHNDCYVISSKLLPYSRQFIALSSFFKKHPTPTFEQRKELKRWFFYTTACQSFMNGSLSNIRAIFNKFEDYINESSAEAGEYEEVKLPSSFKFRMSSRSALADFLMLTQVRRRIKESPSLLESSSFLYYKLSSSPSSYFPLITRGDKLHLQQLIYNNNSIFVSDNDLEQFFLTKEMINDIEVGNYDGFDSKRTAALLDGERELLHSCGLKVIR